MAYMETRPGNRKALQPPAPQQASRVRGRRIIDRVAPYGRYIKIRPDAPASSHCICWTKMRAYNRI